MNQLSGPEKEIVYIPLINKDDNLIREVRLDHAVKILYNLPYRVPRQDELDHGNWPETTDNIKSRISQQDDMIPLFDAYTSNVYIIQKRNVYIRVVQQDYRFPDELIMKSVSDARNLKLKQLSMHPELNNDRVFIRSIRKMELFIEFMNQFDLKILYDTYLSVFYRYAPEIGNSTYTCIRRSFITHSGHLKPYYTKDDTIKLGMNMGLIRIPGNMSYIDFKDTLSQNDYKDICIKIQNNDVSSDILIQHQNYIVKCDMVGLVQYYTIQGSYFINQYLRGMTKYEYRNDYIEENIVSMWKLTLNAPPFDNNYDLYRFVSTDEFIRGLRIGDIFQDKGFMSTTRDPFYRNDLYKFGFILIKIKIPKDIKGVGLCLELMSHFPSEEEIILPPLTRLRLISKNEECEYYHPDEDFAANVKTRYEFEWIGHSEIHFDKRIILPPELETQNVNFLEIKNIKTMTVGEKIDFVMSTYFDPMNRIKCTIGDNTFYVIGEWYDSTGAYSDMYAIKSSHGFSMYTLYRGYMLFMIEIGEIEGQSQIRVNFHNYTKYSKLDRKSILGDDNFIKFISSIAYYFDIPNVIVYADYMSCDSLTPVSSPTSTYIANIDNMQNKKNKKYISRTFKLAEKSKNTLLDLAMNSKNIAVRGHKKAQRSYVNSHPMPKKTIKNKTIDILDTNSHENAMIESVYSDMHKFTGGSYCLDFYRYLKYNEKRYQTESSSTLSAELQPVFAYYDLDGLKTILPSKVLKKEDRDEIYQIYTKTFLPEVPPEKNTLADLYIWMIENKCYLMDLYVKKMDRVYRRSNPFKKGMYILDAMGYLYNRRYIQAYSRYIKMIIDEERQHLVIPKNEYRIRR